MFFKILLLTLVVSSAVGQNGVDICQSKVCACKEETDKMIMECSGLLKSDTFSIENFQWPDNVENLPIYVIIREMTINSVPRLHVNHQVVSVDLRGNKLQSISPTAFTGLTNLSTLILAENNLSYLTPDMLQGLKNLKHLDLSDNELTEISNLVFGDLELFDLNLSGNKLAKIPKEVTEMTFLVHLNISRNSIFSITFQEDATAFHLISIDLSWNSITVLTEPTFSNLKSLKTINLSHNKIGNIEMNTFTNLAELRELDLGHNLLGDAVALPAGVTSLCIERNLYSQWPIQGVSESLVSINVGGNHLDNLELDEKYVHLETLIASSNKLSSLPTIILPMLKELNLAYNQFSEIPSNLNSELLPNLEYLNLNNNPIVELNFKSQLNLKQLNASALQFLKKLDSLSNIVKKSDDGNSNACVEVTITNCLNLVAISETTFAGVPLCKLDLSNNGITYLSRNVLDWSEKGFPLGGVDLQGNPLNCNCELQWILNDLLPRLYTSHPALLQQLRCDAPSTLQGQRLVHWYNWEGQALCEQLSRMKIEEKNIEIMASEDGNVGLQMGSGSGFFVVVALSLVTLFGLIGAAVYLVRQQKRKNLAVRRNRRLQT